MIDLPDSPSPNGATAGLVDFGGFLTPSLGGPVQRIDRLGNRFRIAVSLPPMKSGKSGRIWVSRLARGKSEGVRMPLPLQDFNPGLPGMPVADGAGQSGLTLDVTDGAANYIFREGQFFSILTDGIHHLHMVTAETIADGAGNTLLSIFPMLRVSPADGDECHFAKPMIEGFILGEAWEWEMQLANFVGLAFAIEESE